MWQTPKKEDIKRGVVLFGSSMQRNGGAFAGAVSPFMQQTVSVKSAFFAVALVTDKEKDE